MRIQRRRSGNDDVTADCIASNVGRLTLLAKSDASTGELQRRRRFSAIASPLMAFIAAATGTSTVGQARSSASYAARRTTGSGSVASPRTAGIGRTLDAVGQFDLGGELRGDVGMQTAPRRRTGEREFGGQMLLGLGHLMVGAGGQATQRTAGGRGPRRSRRPGRRRRARPPSRRAGTTAGAAWRRVGGSR